MNAKKMRLLLCGIALAGAGLLGACGSDTHTTTTRETTTTAPAAATAPSSTTTTTTTRQSVD
jgi:hypothetical protein